MTLALLLALQAASPAGAAGADPLAVDFDLAEVKPREGCAPGSGSDIVVCGRRRKNDAYPLEEWERIFATKPLVAETGIGGGARVRAYVDSVVMPNGEVSKRAMVGIKLKF